MLDVLEDSAIRSTARWRTTVHEHRNVSQFMALSELDNGVHTILGGPAPIDLLLRLRPGRPLIFSFHGNTPRNPDLKLPVFTGLNVTGDLDASFVALSDPSLYLDAELKLGWFAGSAGWNLQAIITQLLPKIIDAAQARDVIFFGGSGGGFASLYYSATVPGSLALVWNPQTDITAYNPPHVAEYGRVAFGLPTYEATRSELGSLIECDLAQAYTRPRSNLILYLQNNTDGHVVTHMRPFLASIGADVTPFEKGALLNAEVVPGVRVYMANWGEGHVPPSPASLAQLLADVLRNENGLPALIGSQQIASSLSRTIPNQAA